MRVLSAIPVWLLWTACPSLPASTCEDDECPGGTVCVDDVCVLPASAGKGEGEGEGGEGEGEGGEGEGDTGEGEGERDVGEGEGEGDTGEGEGEGVCGDGVVEGDEDCDVERPDCIACVAVPGLRCVDVTAGDGDGDGEGEGEGDGDGLVCFADFPARFPSHVGAVDLQPERAPSSVTVSICPIETATDAPIDEDGNTPLCGVPVRAFDVDQGRGAPGLRVYVVRDLLTVDGVVRFVGPRVPVIVVFGDLTLGDGAVVDVGADGLRPGPGALVDGCQGRGGDGGNTRDTGGGGGGGGNALAGGRGLFINHLDTGIGGRAITDRAFLQGGCSGGTGGRDTQDANVLAAGGGGGGALQLSVAGTLRLAGVFFADGGGGSGGASSAKGGGGGGGAGGTVFVEARAFGIDRQTLMLTGGGGGGGGRSANGVSGNPGRGGIGGSGAGLGGDGATGGRGGDGGAAGNEGTDGGAASEDTDDPGGGGGGGAGLFRRLPFPVDP